MAVGRITLVTGTLDRIAFGIGTLDVILFGTITHHRTALGTDAVDIITLCN